MTAERRSRLWIVAVLLALMLPACLPLLAGHLPWRADGILHLYRQAHFERALANGDFFPRWLPDLAYGYGFPLFNYYAPLSYYLTLPASLFGDTAFAIRISYTGAILLTGGSLYLWATELLKDARSAIVAAIAGVYAPYLLVNVHQRGALAEVWGIAFLAFAFAGVERLLHQDTRRNLLWVMIAVAALLLVHNITALIAAPLMASYVFVNGRQTADYGRERTKLRENRLVAVIMAAIVGSGVAAFFWMPALLEQEYVQIDRLIGAEAFQWQQHFLAVRELVSVPFSADSTQVNPSIPIGYSIPALLCSIPSIRHKNRRITLWLLTIFVLLTLMSLSASSQIWQSLPLISFIQFPWRFLGPASLILAMLTATGAHFLLNNSQFTIHNSQILFFLLPSSLILFSLPWLFPAKLQQLPDLSPIGSIRYEATSGFFGTTSAADYLPIAVERLPDPESLLELYAAGGRIRAWDFHTELLPEEAFWDTVPTGWTVNSDQPWRFKYDQFYFLGWQVFVDGQAVPTAAHGELGLISAEIPTGQHTITLNWQTTPLRRTAWFLSTISLVTMLAIAIRIPTVSSDSSNLRAIAAFGRNEALTLTAIVLAIAVIKQAWLNHASTIFHRPAFDGQTLQNLPSRLRQDVNFGNTLRLIGIDSEQVVALGEPLHYTLYWTVQPPVSINPTVSIHLVDGNGRLFGQSDNFRPANFPVSRWQAGEYALDAHSIEVLPYTPPGAYGLEIFVLDDMSGQRLERLNDLGQIVGDSLYLSPPTVVIERRDKAVEIDTELIAKAQPLSAEISLITDPLPETLTVGESLELLLYWYFTDNATKTDAILQLRDESDIVVNERLFRPLPQAHPSLLWRKGDLWRDPQALPIPLQTLIGETLQAGAYTVWLQLSGTDDEVNLGSLNIAVPKRNFDGPSLAQVHDVTFDESIRLIGSEVKTSAETLTLDLAFRAEQIMPTSYTAFIHLLDANDQIIAQRDTIPFNGTRPTTGWLPSEIISEIHDFPLPSTGVYRFAIGFYDAETGKRLGERVILPQEIVVEE